MALPRRAATVRTTIAAVEADIGPRFEQDIIPRDRPVLYRWVVGSSLTADSINTLTHNGGTEGRWIRQREDAQGTDIADAAATTITISQNRFRVIPTIGQATAVTLGTTDAVTGDEITITRTDTSAFVMTVVNGGPAAGTLATFPVSVEAFGDFFFEGTNWIKRRSAQML